MYVGGGWIVFIVEVVRQKLSVQAVVYQCMQMNKQMNVQEI